MRLYHFLPANFAIQDIEMRRLKLSEIDGLNDPFELWSLKQTDKRKRIALRAWKKDMSKRFGLLCFSRDWKNPLLWSHYGDRHRGICLGFDVQNDFVTRVKYLKNRPFLPTEITEKACANLLFTKFAGWEYEEEWRVWARREKADVESGFYFRDFDERIKLTEIIVGPLCETSQNEIIGAIDRRESDVSISKARLAFRSFSVVKNLQGFGA